MNCQKIREQLDAALDDQCVISSQTNAPRHAEVLSHVESCSDCRVLYEEHLLIGTALAAWVPQRPTVDLTDRVIDAARQEGLVATVRSVVRPSPAESSPQGRNIWPTIATVALVLVAVAIVFRENPGTIAVNDPAQEQVVPDQPPELLRQPQDQVADISHLVADAQSAWQGITSRVSHQASGFSVFVPDLKNELGISDDLNSAPDSDDSSDDAVPRKSPEPSAVEKAFEFLFKDDDSAGTLTI